jgi:2,3-bisphosphoglycerate-independent phosphoglycerate mutase
MRVDRKKKNMKYILISISGAADHPAEELGGKTPLELAKIPNLNYFSKVGKLGQVKLIPERLDPSSDVSFLNLLGYDADKVYTGRGPIEAANMDLKLEDNEIAFRMNFITEADGVMADPTGGKITTKEAKALINFLNKKVASDFVRFFPGAEYRHIAVLKDSHGYEALSAHTVAPEMILGERIEQHLPKGPGEELIKKLMYDAKLLLQNHEINQVRVDLHENPANMIWLWGQGIKPQLEKFSERFGLVGSVMSDIEYAKGVARIAGLTVFEMNGALEDEETKYEKIGKLLMNALSEKDFVCLHLQDCDTASLAGDLKAKISAIEGIDFFILSRIKEYLESYKDVRVIVTPCHTLPWKTRKYARDYVPFAMAGKNVMPDDFERFSETAAKASTLKINKGSDFVKYFLSKEAAVTART